MEEKVKELYEKGRTFIEKLKSSPDNITVTYIWDILCTFIHLAEETIDIPKTGIRKTEIVLELWNEANKELNFVNINYLIEKYLIPVVVRWANKYGWGN